jgi:glyoxylase-like metal-dependent hydrolase (beta-lactamase superfamily II)
MRIHHLNCISTCPLGGRLMDGRTKSMVRRGELACHCLLVEAQSQLVLVDTGLGLRDVANPRDRLSAFFLGLVSPALREEMTAIRQVERLGYDPRDVGNIVLTHLDFDHAGGLDDFPHATVHMMQVERDCAAAQRTWLDRQRFRPQQWSTRANWRVYCPSATDRWFGLQRVRALDGLEREIVLVPLAGHTHGHAGVAVQDGERWLLLAGDAYFFHGEVDPAGPHCTPGLRFYQWMMEKDRSARIANQVLLRALRRTRPSQVTIFSAHDVTEFEQLSGRSSRVPTEHLAHEARRAMSSPVDSAP